MEALKGIDEFLVNIIVVPEFISTSPVFDKGFEIEDPFVVPLKSCNKIRLKQKRVCTPHRSLQKNRKPISDISNEEVRELI